METTPLAITPLVLELANQIGIGKPEFVPVEPAPGAVFGKCWLNVWAVAGGRNHPSVVYGWIIWECPHTVTSEWHCVLRRENGELVDLTPKPDGETRILFVPSVENKAPESIPLNRGIAKDLAGRQKLERYVASEKWLVQNGLVSRKLPK